MSFSPNGGSGSASFNFASIASPSNLAVVCQVFTVCADVGTFLLVKPCANPTTSITVLVSTFAISSLRSCGVERHDCDGCLFGRFGACVEP